MQISAESVRERFQLFRFVFGFGSSGTKERRLTEHGDLGAVRERRLDVVLVHGVRVRDGKRRVPPCKQRDALIS